MSDESLKPQIDAVTAKIDDMRVEVATLDAKVQDCLTKSREYRTIREKASSDRTAIVLRGIEPLEAQLRELVAAENMRLRAIVKQQREIEPTQPSPQEIIASLQKQIEELKAAKR